MPPTNQRRNHAYLNPLIERPAIYMGLAIELGGSVEQCFRPADLAGGFGAPPRYLGAAEPEGRFLR